MIRVLGRTSPTHIIVLSMLKFTDFIYLIPSSFFPRSGFFRFNADWGKFSIKKIHVAKKLGFHVEQSLRSTWSTGQHATRQNCWCARFSCRFSPLELELDNNLFYVGNSTVFMNYGTSLLLHVIVVLSFQHCSVPDPELLFRIQQIMKEQINKNFISNFRLWILDYTIGRYYSMKYNMADSW